MRLKTIQALNKIKYPTDVLMLDFEARFGKRFEMGFEYQSNIEYIRHPEWEFLGCGFQLMTPRRNHETYVINGPDISQHLLGLFYKYGRKFERVTVVAKNAKFDMMILQHHYGIVPEYIIDLDDLLRFYDARMSHHLKDVSKMEGLPGKGDTTSFANTTYNELIASPRALDQFIKYTKRDIDNQCELFERYLPRVEYTPLEAFMARHTLDLYINPQFDIDRPRATRIKTGMTLQLKKMCREYDAKMLGSPIKLITEMGELLAVHDERVPLKHCDKNKKGKYPDASKNMIPLLEKYGDPSDDVPLLKARPAFAKEDDGCKWMQAHTDQKVRDLMMARIGIKSWPTHIDKVRGILDQSQFDGLHVPLHYYGAHTGRFTGGHAINLLNMGGKGRMTPIHTLISQVRSVLKARKGGKLSMADSCQIEARILSWLAGQHDLTEDFRNNGDPYSTLSSDIFKARVWKWDEDNDVEEYAGQQTIVDLQRGFGKDSILGGGYGMGGAKFHSRCLQNDKLRPYFDRGEYDLKFCKGIIDTYRGKYRCIPGFWRKVEKAWKVATRHPGNVIRVPIPRTSISLKFYHENQSLNKYLNGITTIELPSGRKLRYCKARVTPDGDLKWRWGILWGGTITENICQAISRDLMVWWIEKLEHAAGFDFNVVLHCYDDITASVPTESAETHLAEQIAIMETGPDWSHGLPLGAEGKLREVYAK
ncbi:hypothetical protein LCGC14_0343020 [marine sediment metagenome]|uniref:DNA-directed DNA polymerase family A palm domain-containing protein n=1 Tax=marine sediment metagenome TaxID=412755 RepID=A0A0F9TIM7_9ZZZZ